MAPPPPARLDGWKAIAEYLGRDARTLQRWRVERGRAGPSSRSTPKTTRSGRLRRLSSRRRHPTLALYSRFNASVSCGSRRGRSARGRRAGPAPNQAGPRTGRNLRPLDERHDVVELRIHQTWWPSLYVEPRDDQFARLLQRGRSDSRADIVRAQSSEPRGRVGSGTIRRSTLVDGRRSRRPAVWTRAPLLAGAPRWLSGIVGGGRSPAF